MEKYCSPRYLTCASGSVRWRPQHNEIVTCIADIGFAINMRFIPVTGDVREPVPDTVM